MTECSERPRRREGLISTGGQSEFFIYSAADEQMHVLNATARFIWEMCDGEHSPEEMAAALKEGFAVPRERDVLADVHAILRTLRSKGLLLRAC